MLKLWEPRLNTRAYKQASRRRSGGSAGGKMRVRSKKSAFIRTFGAAALIAASASANAGDGGDAVRGPLKIAKQGSFFIGGDSVYAPHAFGNSTQLSGTITVNQMYVSYQIPVNARNQYPIVLIHGGDLSGESYDTTPDGRMGWDEYFVRRGFRTYVPDQVSRARSGFDLRAINEVRLGLRPVTDLPVIFVAPDEFAWTLFRFGPKPGVPFADEKFPYQAASELSKQVVPDFNNALPGGNNNPIPTIDHLSTLATQLKGAILLGHSQSGVFPFQVALQNPANVKAAIALEPGPGDCNNSTYTDQQIAQLAKIPILIEFGDHIQAVPSWVTTVAACKALISRIKHAGGNVTLYHLPNLGIHGNSHMVMQDTNNLDIADLIITWINNNVH